MPAAPETPPAESVASSDLEFGRSVLRSEGEKLLELTSRLGADFLGAVEAILGLKGRVVVTGMGKAGLVGKKIAATLASTGTPSFFLHPADALHGDLGMATGADLLLALSNSGETEEIVRLIPHVIRRIPIAAVTAGRGSTLGRAADWVIEMGDAAEACPLGLAPSVSSTAMLALGDALALTVQRRRGFSDEDFARFHPGGSLGRKFARVSEFMRSGERCPTASADITVFEAIRAITRARAGSLVIAGEEGKLLGIFTDGDFRRHWTRDPEIGPKPIRDFMTAPCLFIRDDARLGDARALMASRKINELPVVDAQGVVMGLLDIQDIVQAR